MSFIQGLNAPIGCQYFDDNSLARGTSRQLRNGTVLNRASYPALYAATKLQFGKNCNFNASGSSIVTMTSNTAPSGYIVTSSLSQTTDYYAMDGSTGSSFPGNSYQESWWQLEHPSRPILGAMIGSSGPTETYKHTPSAVKVDLYDGSIWHNVLRQKSLVWSSGYMTISLPFDTPYYGAVTKTKFTFAGCQGGMGYGQGVYELGIYGADLSKILCVGHGYSTTQAVTVQNPNGALPAGLTEGTTYYVRNIDANNFTLHDTAAHATANTNAIAITNAGTGSFKIWASDTFPLDTLANSYIAY